MGLRFRKSINLGGARINFSKAGIGYSVGGKGFLFTKKASGGTRTTISIPGTGVSYVNETGRCKTKHKTHTTLARGKKDVLKKQAFHLSADQVDSERVRLYNLSRNSFIGFVFFAILLVIGVAIESAIFAIFCGTLCVFFIVMRLGSKNKLHDIENMSIPVSDSIEE